MAPLTLAVGPEPTREPAMEAVEKPEPQSLEPLFPTGCAPLEAAGELSESVALDKEHVAKAVGTEAEQVAEPLGQRVQEVGVEVPLGALGVQTIFLSAEMAQAFPVVLREESVVAAVAGGGEPGQGAYSGQNGLTQNAVRPTGGGGGGSIGAAAITDLAMTTTFQVGSGGGGGGRSRDNAFEGSGGGGGGGALRIASPTSIVVRGDLLARGGNGGTPISTSAGCGGGGSGGAIYLSAPTIDIDGRVDTGGGLGATNGVDGGNGGIGRIRLSVIPDPGHCSIAGTTVPVLSTAGCVETEIAERIYIASFPN